MAWILKPLSEVTDKRVEAINWRNRELRETDWIVPITDHSKWQDFMDYRQALREWPSTPNFPDIKPISPAEV